MTYSDPDLIEAAVLAVLAGEPPANVASRIPIDPADLADAADRYRAAGHAALHDQAAGRWQQVRVDFTDWKAAEHAGITRLGPALAEAETSGIIAAWFFTRKAATWRVRCLPAHDVPTGTVTAFLHHTVDAITAHGHATGWCPGSYEPETRVFGGPAAMDIAHHLFHTDSANILAYLARTGEPLFHGGGQAELFILLSSVLLRGAGLDWYEQGDVWALAADHRTPGGGPQPTREAMHRLMTVDTGPRSTLTSSGPLKPIAGWVTAFDQAGRALKALTDDGALHRGLRAVLAHHLLFHGNRLGMPAPAQGTVTALARDVAMDDPGTAVSTSAAPHHTVRL